MTIGQVGPGSGNPLDAAPLGNRQRIILALAILIAALDGFDMLAMALVAPAVAEDWQLDKAVLGLLLSSGLVGMAIGSIFVAPLADRVGRKTVVLGCLALLTAGAAASALSPSVAILAASRVVTGIGIGTMVVMTTLISAEFSNVRFRPVAVAAIATLGFPIGGIIGGLGASALLKYSTWHSVFGAGAIAGALLFVLVAITLPESPAYLLARQPRNALDRLNAVLHRLGHAPFGELPAAEEARHKSYAGLFRPRLAGVTVRLAAVNALVAAGAYYLLNWLPQLVVDAGFPVATGSLVSAVSGAIGLIGGTLFGALAMRFRANRLAAGAMLAIALSLAAFGLAPPLLPMLIVTAGLFGLALSGSTGSFLGILATSFPPELRAAGTGLVMGIGRIGSAAGPALAGWLFATGFTRTSVSIAFAVGPVIAAMLMLTLRPTHAAAKS